MGLNPEYQEGQTPLMEVRDVADLGQQRREPRAAPLGLLDHAPLGIAEWAHTVGREHAKVSGHHGERRAKLVHGERQHLRKQFCPGRR